MSDDRTYSFPVWGTQGGGLVRQVNGVYIFVEKPQCPGLDVGDKMPDEWGIAPANAEAHREAEQDVFREAERLEDVIWYNRAHGGLR